MSIKAFELVPVIETVHTSGDRAHIKIECIEFCGRELFIGTSDGMVLSYILEEKHLPNGKLVYSYKKVYHKNTELKKPIKIIKTASALDRIFVFCDLILLIYMPVEKDIKAGPKLRGFSTFCINENAVSDSPFSVQICVGRKQHIQIYNFLQPDKFELVKDISVSGIPLQLVADSFNVCAAFPDQYVVYNFQSNTQQQLFPYNCENFTPIICRITKEEFLLTATENLGMFTDAQGVSRRPPVHWSHPLSSLTYSHPYILGVGDEFIAIYSILDQQQKQILPFIGGRFIGNFDGKVFVHSPTAIYSLSPVPWEKQVEILLGDEKVSEALELIQTIDSVSLSKEQSAAVFQKIHQRAGFIYFSKADFDKALEHFEYGNVDIREVIALYPGFLPASSNFVRAIPPLHGIADVVQLFCGNEEKLIESKNFLLHFLEIRRQLGSQEHLMELDTALIKLYSELNVPQLEVFVSTGNVCCDIKDCCSWLEKRDCLHVLALLYKQAGEYDKALDIWSKIISSDTGDDTFSFGCFIDLLSDLHNPDLTWKYAEFVLNKDQELGVRIFTNPADFHSENLKPDTIVEFLRGFPSALIKYLEYIVLQEDVQDERFHTQLAMVYTENILNLKKQGKNEDATVRRTVLQNFLMHSNLLRVHLLVNKMREAELHKEMSILYGKIEEHEKALQILVCKLKLYKEAELYCASHSVNQNCQYRRDIFFILLSIYMNPDVKDAEREEYYLHALDLLNSRPRDFDAVKVLDITPPSWSVAILRSFLQGSLRDSLCKVHKTQIECALMRGDNVKKSVYLYKLEKQLISVLETNCCCVCKKPFYDGSFARYPNNILTHIGCAKYPNICPITGRNFKMFKL